MECEQCGSSNLIFSKVERSLEHYSIKESKNTENDKYIVVTLLALLHNEKVNENLCCLDCGHMTSVDKAIDIIYE